MVEPRGRNEIGGLATTDRWKWTKQGLPCHTASWSGRVWRGRCAERCTSSGDRMRGDDGQPQERSDGSTRTTGFSPFVERFHKLRLGKEFELWIPSWTLGSMPVPVTGARVSRGPRESGGGVCAHMATCVTRSVSSDDDHVECPNHELKRFTPLGRGCGVNRTAGCTSSAVPSGMARWRPCGSRNAWSRLRGRRESGGG